MNFTPISDLSLTETLRSGLPLYRIPEIKTKGPQAFFVKKVCRNTERFIFCLNDFWNFQILSSPSVKTTFIADVFVVIFVWATFLGLFVFSSDAEVYSEPFQTYFKHKMEVFTKIAIDYFDKKLHLWCSIGGVSNFTVLDTDLPHFLHRINTSGPKIRPVLKKFIFIFHKVENVKSWYCRK